MGRGAVIITRWSKKKREHELGAELVTARATLREGQWPDYGGRMDRESAQDWLRRYVAAWMSYDPDEIAELFSEDVAYRYHPSDEPIVGRAAVVASWLGKDATEDASSRDAAGTYEAEYFPVAIDGDTVVATGTSRYRDLPDGSVVRTYDNCFVMRFDGDGKCCEFTEYYNRRP